MLHVRGYAGLILLLAGIAALVASEAVAQTDVGLASPTGHEVDANVSGYTYTEPGAQSISIHGAKVGGEYTVTLSLSKRHHWFTQTDARGIIGSVTYSGWCAPSQALVGGAVFRALERQRLGGERPNGDVYGQSCDSPGADRLL